ncbi:hypothetical protein ACFORG_11495 [Lutimaribacter marinistellae]|uniref:Uncharacterized protein n=1 Tax=Lutimaribacter marinistellae TaxID=1820329 RepID=A0ABV7TGN0_9RHOB
MFVRHSWGMVETDTDLSVAMRAPTSRNRLGSGFAWITVVGLSATAFAVVTLAFLSARLHEEEVAALDAAPSANSVEAQTASASANAEPDIEPVPEPADVTEAPTVPEAEKEWSLGGLFGGDGAREESSLPAEPFTMIRSMPASRTPVRRGGE